MARAPRASVPKSSGQGVSRLSYQKGYALGTSRGASEFRANTQDSPKPRNYAKHGRTSADEVHVSYGGMAVPELDDTPPKSAIPDRRVRAKQYGS